MKTTRLVLPLLVILGLVGACGSHSGVDLKVTLTGEALRSAGDIVKATIEAVGDGHTYDDDVDTKGKIVSGVFSDHYTPHVSTGTYQLNVTFYDAVGNALTAGTVTVTLRPGKTVSATITISDVLGGIVPHGDGASDLSGDMAAAPGSLDFSSGWSFSHDDGCSSCPTVIPTIMLSSTASSATLTSVGGDGSTCSCNAQHNVITLPAAVDCATAKLVFDYTTSGHFAYTSTTSLEVLFLAGTSGQGSFYGSEQTGHSNCAPQLGNSFPTTPQLVEGTNTIKLSSLVQGTSGSCNGSFTSVDVHIQAYGCFTADSTTATLSNFRVLAN